MPRIENDKFDLKQYFLNSKMYYPLSETKRSKKVTSDFPVSKFKLLAIFVDRPSGVKCKI